MAGAPRRTTKRARGAKAAAPGAEVPPEQPKRGGVRWELVEARLFEVAADLFAERGYAGTSLQDIAEAMGMSRSALYYYVKSKEDVLVRLVERFPMHDANVLRAVVAREHPDAASKLAELVREQVRLIAAERARFQLMDNSESHMSPALMKRYAGARRTILTLFREVIEEGIASGEFRAVDARVAALGIIGMCNWVPRWFAPERDSLSDVAEAFVDMTLGALAETRGEPRGPHALVRGIRRDLTRLESLLPGS